MYGLFTLETVMVKNSNPSTKENKSKVISNTFYVIPNMLCKCPLTTHIKLCIISPQIHNIMIDILMVLSVLIEAKHDFGLLGECNVPVFVLSKNWLNFMKSQITSLCQYRCNPLLVILTSMPKRQHDKQEKDHDTSREIYIPFWCVVWPCVLCKVWSIQFLSRIVLFDCLKVKGCTCIAHFMYRYI